MNKKFLRALSLSAAILVIGFTGTASADFTVTKTCNNVTMNDGQFWFRLTDHTHHRSMNVGGFPTKKECEAEATALGHIA